MQIKQNSRSMWSTRKTPVVKRVWLIIVSFYAVLTVTAQSPVAVGGGSFASFVPLAESASSSHGGCQAYQMEHRPIYAVDSLLTRPLPSNDWWTYGLVNPWTGNLWAYPAVTWATDQGISVAKLTHWEPTGSEMKWETPVFVSTVGTDSKPIFFSEKRLSDWSDFMIRFVMEQDGAQVEVTVMRGSPIVWMEFTGCQPAAITNPKSSDFAIYQQTVGDKIVVAVAVLADGQTADTYAPYAYRIPRRTRYSYNYNQTTAKVSTTFHVDYQDLVSTSAQGVAMGFLPHHYQNTTANVALTTTYATPRGQMRMAYGNDFTFTYDVHPMLPFFPLPDENLEGYSAERMQQLCKQYAAAGTFGADTYWGGKGLTQMMHYMTSSLQMGDTATYRVAKKRLKEYLINWYTYTPGETQYYFAYYNRWRALVGFDVSYDSDTFNDHHFHYGYFIYASAVLCMLDPDFKEQYGAMAREVARDYANWTRDDYSDHTGGILRQPWFRMFSPYDGHSFAGGMGNGGNGNGQESTSESMQSWVGIWMLGMALNDPEMLQAGVMGYTVEARATAEYWFDRGRRNIDYTKYTHPWCCNLTMAGVGWWTWFSGDPVWMHSIQWLPISPGLQNYLTEDRDFTRWDYTEMYKYKEVGNYEAATGGLGNESGLGNVCLSYLALFDPDSAAHVWDRMDQQGKPLAKNPDTGGITYLLAHGLRQYGHHNHAITADYPLAAAYTTDGGVTTYVVYNVDNAPRTVHFIGGGNMSVSAPANALSFFNASGQLLKSTEPIADDNTQRPKDPIAEDWDHAYPNVALHKTATVSSAENAGCVAVNLTDGNLSTRWGSIHQDGEWAQVDLGDLYYIDHVTLRWEAAYASKFELSLSPDGTNWHSVIYTGSGGVDTRDFAGDLLVQGDSARGRYIRIVGLERATTYGTSIYELEAYGLPLAGDPDALISLEIVSNDISLVPGQTPAYEVHGYNYLGTELAINPTINHQSSINQYEVTAEYGGIKTSYTWPILEQVATVAARVTPRSVILSPGDVQEFTIETIDQFGYTTKSETRTYTASQLGLDAVLYTLDGFTDTAFISVIAFTERNLALGKPANCSGYEDGATLALNVNDGKLNTRWGSRYQDNEWVQVDLGGDYLINRVRILWETSYASSYEIQFSNDMLAWTTAYETTAGNGGVDEILLPTTSARFVRVLCRVRHNPTYGSSIYELEVYGLPEADTDAPVMTAATFVSATCEDAVLAVSATDNDHVLAYPVYNGAELLGEFTAVNGQITVTGLAPFTEYTFNIWAKDCSGNVSEQSLPVTFRTAALPVVATASSEVGANVAANALVRDGRWESASTDTEWWMINYNRLHSFDAIRIEWEGAYAKEFTIEGSLDGTNFDILYTETNGSAGEHFYSLANVVEYQYIKVNITKRATNYGNSIIYFEAYVADSPVLTTLTLSAAKAYAAIGQNVALTVAGRDQYNAPMAELGEVEYTVTPASAGSVVAGQFVPAQKGRATIAAHVGEVVANEVEVYVITENVNLALSTDITTDNKIIAQSGNGEGANNAFYAVNANDGDTWNTPDPGVRTYDAWFVVDLGANFDLELATVHFEGASSKNFHIDASLDNVVWTQVATGTTPGMQNITTVHGITATTARYVRFWSTEAATGYGLKVYTFQVFGQRNTAGDIHPTAVSLNKTATSLAEGSQVTLTATITPADATNKAVSWTSDNTAVATVDANGVITAIAVGQATITVTTVDGGFTASCVVTVTPPQAKYYYSYAHGSHLDITFHLIYNLDHTVTVVVPHRYTDHTGLGNFSFSIGGEWKDMSLDSDGNYTRTTEKTFTYGQSVECFFQQDIQGGATGSGHFTYVVGSENELPSFSLTTVDNDFYSFYYPYEVTIPDGITAFTGALNGTQLVLQQVTGTTIPAYTAVLVKTDVPGTYVFPAVETRTAPFENNSLLGVATQTSFEELGEDTNTKILTLGVAGGVVGFRQHNSAQTELKANRVYLKWQSAAQVTVRIVMITTSVEEVEDMPHVQKLIRNGQVYIVRDGQTYNILGL